MCSVLFGFPSRTGPDTVVLNSSEPSKEKEKQGFFRAIKKKKKKSQMVSCILNYFKPCLDAVFHTHVLSAYYLSSSAFQIFKTLLAQKYKVISSVWPVPHVSLCHQSHSSYYRCKFLKEDALSRKVFSLCLVQRLTQSIDPQREPSL